MKQAFFTHFLSLSFLFLPRLIMTDNEVMPEWCFLASFPQVWMEDCQIIDSLERIQLCITWENSNDLFSSWGVRKLRVNWAQENRTINYLRNSNYLFSSWEPRRLRAYLPTLLVFPVDYQKTGPATGLPEIFWVLPDFSQPDTIVQKVKFGQRLFTMQKVRSIVPKTGFLSERALKLVGRWRPFSCFMTASLRSVACNMVESTVRELVCFGFDFDRGGDFVWD